MADGAFHLSHSSLGSLANPSPGCLEVQSTRFQAPPPGVGFNLAVVYASWIAGVLILYPLCKWFAG